MKLSYLSLLLIFLSLNTLKSSARKVNSPTDNDLLQYENETDTSNKQKQEERLVADRHNENDADKLYLYMKKTGAGGGGHGRGGTAGGSTGGGSSNSIHHPNTKSNKNGASLGIIYPLNSFIFTCFALALFICWT
ncbi:Constitutive coactivator of PPAR-gamma-like protein 2 [Bienertia sinuspersici]